MILWVRVDNQRSYRVLCNNLHVNAPHNLLWRALLTSCSRVVRSLIVDKSHMHALPSVPPVTTTPLPAPGPVRSINRTDSTLSSSLCPSSAPTMSPFERETTRTPPDTPPTTTSVDDEFTAREVMPSSSNRASEAVTLKIGVGDRGSQTISVPSSSAVTIRFPGVRWISVRGTMSRIQKKHTVRSEFSTLH